MSKTLEGEGGSTYPAPDDDDDACAVSIYICIYICMCVCVFCVYTCIIVDPVHTKTLTHENTYACFPARTLGLCGREIQGGGDERVAGWQMQRVLGQANLLQLLLATGREFIHTVQSVVPVEVYVKVFRCGHCV